MALAGLWDSWTGPAGPLESFTILTTSANGTVSPVHDRMPVILDPSGHCSWLDGEVNDSGELDSLLVMAPHWDLEAFPVGPYVNKAGNEGPRCLESAFENTLWPEEKKSERQGF